VSTVTNGFKPWKWWRGRSGDRPEREGASFVYPGRHASWGSAARSTMVDLLGEGRGVSTMVDISATGRCDMGRLRNPALAETVSVCRAAQCNSPLNKCSTWNIRLA
jgi:hypothetical protein